MTAASRTLVLSRRDIAGLMIPADYLEAAETAFRAAAEGSARSPPPMHLEGSGGAFHAKGASLQVDRLYVALKLNGNFPGNPDRHGLPTIQGALLLCDGSTGSLLAVMDSIEVTLRRTAAATALAARHLARPDSRSVLVCGCGDQARAQLAALREVLPLRRCFAWDRDMAKAERFAEWSASQGLEAEAAGELRQAASRSDVIIACTTSRSFYLTKDIVRPGTFVAAVGADSPEKSEVAPELMAAATVVADVRDQCAVMGDLHHAVDAGAMAPADVHAELAELVSGRKPGRRSAEEVTVFDSTGTALQDVAAAAVIYQRALRLPGAVSVEMGSL